jgi:hypothetical protein
MTAINYNTIKNKKIGYYVVHDPAGKVAYSNKSQALLHASKTKSHVEWNFNEEAFNKVNWTIEPPETLSQLYCQRALQLRQTYDYLVLNYSGGSDSKNILDTFLNNNIHIDEILIRWPRKGTEKIYVPNSIDYVPENVYSEWDLVMLPDIQWISTHHPQIKITVWDYTEEVIDLYNDIDWITRVNGEHLNPAQIGRYAMGMDMHKRVLDKGSKVAHIHGLDKPRVAHENGKFYCFFLDSVANQSGMVYDDSVDVMNTQELFYWTPDFPKIIVKQAHIVSNFFKSNPYLLHLIARGFVPYSSRTAYEMIIKSLIYPTWDPKRFQAPKPSSVFYCEYDEWFFNAFKDTDIFETWKRGLEYVTDNVDSKYLNFNRNGKPNGFSGYVSTHYDLGI